MDNIDQHHCNEMDVVNPMVQVIRNCLVAKVVHLDAIEKTLVSVDDEGEWTNGCSRGKQRGEDHGIRDG